MRKCLTVGQVWHTLEYRISLRALVYTFPRKDSFGDCPGINVHYFIGKVLLFLAVHRILPFLGMFRGNLQIH